MLFLDSAKGTRNDLQQNRTIIRCWLKSAYLPKKKYAKILDKNHTMLNFIEGGTTLLFCSFDKTQYLWRYRA